MKNKYSYIDDLMTTINSITEARTNKRLRQAKDLAEKIFANIVISAQQEDIPDFIWSDIGLELYFLHNYRLAEEAFLNALQQAEKLPDEEQKILSAILGDLASVYEKMHKFEDALGLYQRSLRIRKNLHKSNHELVLMVKEDIIRVKQRMAPNNN